MSGILYQFINHRILFLPLCAASTIPSKMTTCASADGLTTDEMLRLLLQLSLKREQRDEDEREERAEREKEEREDRDAKHGQLLRAIYALAGSRSDTPVPTAVVEDPKTAAEPQPAVAAEPDVAIAPVAFVPADLDDKDVAQLPAGTDEFTFATSPTLAAPSITVPVPQPSEHGLMLPLREVSTDPSLAESAFLEFTGSESHGSNPAGFYATAFGDSLIPSMGLKLNSSSTLGSETPNAFRGVSKSLHTDVAKKQETYWYDVDLHIFETLPEPRQPEPPPLSPIQTSFGVITAFA